MTAIGGLGGDLKIGEGGRGLKYGRNDLMKVSCDALRMEGLKN